MERKKKHLSSVITCQKKKNNVYFRTFRELLRLSSLLPLLSRHQNLRDYDHLKTHKAKGKEKKQ